MSNEIAASLSLNNTALDVNRQFSFRGDQTLQRRQTITKNVGTSVESVSVDSDLTTTGFVLLYNRDPTNFVDWGFTSGTYGGTLLPGDDMPAFFRLKSNAIVLYFLANAAACDVDVEIWGK